VLSAGVSDLNCPWLEASVEPSFEVLLPPWLGVYECDDEGGRGVMEAKVEVVCHVEW
jgi:hypothetical protein